MLTFSQLKLLLVRTSIVLCAFVWGFRMILPYRLKLQELSIRAIIFDAAK
jgi:hypothetical protein